MKRLVYKQDIDRFVIKGEAEGDERELHCGNTFEVLIGEHWVRTTIEMQWVCGIGKYYLTTLALSLENIVNYKVPVR